MLLPYVQNAQGPLRQALGRVLGEVATPSLGLDLLQFVADDVEELRAAVARAFAHAPSGVAFDVLNELARDPTWFVRLRAIVSLGKLADRRGIPALLGGLTDSNRLVRLRAAEALVVLNIEMVPILQQVVAAGDRYGLHAFLTAVENANALPKLQEEVKTCALPCEEKTRLQSVLDSGSLSPEDLSSLPNTTAVAALP
jgi:HEAT repeat protein